LLYANHRFPVLIFFIYINSSMSINSSRKSSELPPKPKRKLFLRAFAFRFAKSRIIKRTVASCLHVSGCAFCYSNSRREQRRSCDALKASARTRACRGRSPAGRACRGRSPAGRAGVRGEESRRSSVSRAKPRAFAEAFRKSRAKGASRRAVASAERRARVNRARRSNGVCRYLK